MTAIATTAGSTPELLTTQRAGPPSRTPDEGFWKEVFDQIQNPARGQDAPVAPELSTHGHTGSQLASTDASDAMPAGNTPQLPPQTLDPMVSAGTTRPPTSQETLGASKLGMAMHFTSSPSAGGLAAPLSDVDASQASTPANAMSEVPLSSPTSESAPVSVTLYQDASGQWKVYLRALHLSPGQALDAVSQALRETRGGAAAEVSQVLLNGQAIYGQSDQGDQPATDLTSSFSLTC